MMVKNYQNTKKERIEGAKFYLSVHVHMKILVLE